MDKDAEILRLRRIIGKMTGDAQGGICQFTASGKNAFLNDIKARGMAEGFDILGMPEDKTEWDAFYADSTAE